MLFDIEQLLADGEAIPTATATKVGASYKHKFIGHVGSTVSFLVNTDAGGTGTVRFKVVRASDSALTSNVQVIASTDAIPVADLVAGKKFALTFANDSRAGNWIGLAAEVTGTPSGGTFTAFLGIGNEDWDDYPVESGY